MARITGIGRVFFKAGAIAPNLQLGIRSTLACRWRASAALS